MGVLRNLESLSFYHPSKSIMFTNIRYVLMILISGKILFSSNMALLFLQIPTQSPVDKKYSMMNLKTLFNRQRSLYVSIMTPLSMILKNYTYLKLCPSCQRELKFGLSIIKILLVGAKKRFRNLNVQLGQRHYHKVQRFV